MTNVNTTSFRKNLYEMTKNAIENNETTNVSTKNGNVIVMSENDYESLMETLYIESTLGAKGVILRADSEKFEDCFSIDEVDLNV